jgi:hypothetical protein
VANRAPDRLRRLTEDASNFTKHLRDSVIQAIDTSRAVDVGMKRMFSSKIDDPLATTSLIVPIPRALIDEPPMPVTVLSAIGCKVVKSERSGEMCVVQALSRRNGDDSKETSERLEEGGRGATMMAADLIPQHFSSSHASQQKHGASPESQAKHIPQYKHICRHQQRT